MTTIASVSGSATSRYSSLPVSSSNACPRAPSRDATGSIKPTGTPTASSSARCASFASSSGGTLNDAERQSASATETMSAAEDDSPDPIGSVESTAPSQPTGGP